MAKIIILILFFSVAGINNLKAQDKAKADVIATAKKDARNFKLEKSLLKIWRKEKEATSDYFKPNESNTSDGSLLTGSIYVRKFRSVAYERTSLRFSTGRLLFIGGVGVAGTAVVATILLNTISIN